MCERNRGALTGAEVAEGVGAVWGAQRMSQPREVGAEVWKREGSPSSAGLAGP